MLALTMGVMVGVSAAQDAALAMSIDSVTPADPSLGALKKFLPYPAEQEEALKQQERATLNAIEAMAAPRVIILTLLSGAAMLVFFTTLQIRWSVEAPHVGLAKRLGVIAIVAAILRTLSGAQDLVIVRRAAAASAKVLLNANVPDAETTVTVTQALVNLASVGWTLVVVGLFVGLAAYFRSPKVQQASFVDVEDDE
jgi:hypothetical protein